MDIFIVNLTSCNLTLTHHEHPAPERTLLTSNHSMPKLRHSRTWIILSLILAGVYLHFGSPPADAAQLIDVRIGEYDGFTRIVFEVDAPPQSPKIEIVSTGNLKVSFDRTDVNLVRKIPVERSRHIKAIQFWQTNDQLSTVLMVDYPHFRYETFPLNNPPRIAVDIFPTAPPVSVDTPPTTSESPAATQPDTPIEKETPRQATNQETTEPEGSAKLPVEESIVEEEHPPMVTIKDAPKVPKPKLDASDRKKELKAPPSKTSRQTMFRLQFFLVIGLVVITIGILFLLLMMLFARHRFSEVKTKLSTGDVLKQQDQKIDALNSRIKEQFERYDQA